jgi:hypothetical protein
MLRHLPETVTIHFGSRLSYIENFDESGDAVATKDERTDTQGKKRTQGVRLFVEKPTKDAHPDYPAEPTVFECDICIGCDVSPPAHETNRADTIWKRESNPPSERRWIWEGPSGIPEHTPTEVSSPWTRQSQSQDRTYASPRCGSATKKSVPCPFYRSSTLTTDRTAHPHIPHRRRLNTQPRRLHLGPFKTGRRT